MEKSETGEEASGNKYYGLRAADCIIFANS